MIIACPACTTRYVVPDSAIGVDGRTVRCAKCRNSWFQEGPELAPAGEAPVSQPAAAPEPVTAPAPAPVREEPAARQEASAPVTASPAEPAAAEPTPAREAPVAAPRPAARYDDSEINFPSSRSSFEHEPPFRPRRNTLKLYTIGAAAFAVIAMAAIGAVAWYGLPDWAPFARQTFAEAQPDLVLEFPPNQLDRRTLPNGTEYFGASGMVRNIGKERRTVPPILVVLRDSHDRIVYSWEVVAPKRQLAPGESVTINEAVTDVPRTAKVAEIGWKPG